MEIIYLAGAVKIIRIHTLKQGLKNKAVNMTPVVFIITWIITLFGRSKSLNTIAQMYTNFFQLLGTLGRGYRDHWEVSAVQGEVSEDSSKERGEA